MRGETAACMLLCNKRGGARLLPASTSLTHMPSCQQRISGALRSPVLPRINLTVAMQGVVASFAWMILIFIGWYGESRPHSISWERMMTRFVRRQSISA